MALTKFDTTRLKQHKTLTATTLYLLKYECMEFGCTWHDVRDANRIACIRFLKHFKSLAS